jgi:hypothetical protein
LAALTSVESIAVRYDRPIPLTLSTLGVSHAANFDFDADGGGVVWKWSSRSQGCLARAVIGAVYFAQLGA